jgi:hypothetical protein
MLKASMEYCRKCCKRTPHSYVGSKNMLDGFGIARVILAVASLGTSETVRGRYWQCQKCGEIKEGD